MKRIRPIDASGLMNLLEKELDMNGITDWGKGYNLNKGGAYHVFI